MKTALPIVFCALVLGAQATAGPITFDLVKAAAGAAHADKPPWLTATFRDLGPGVVELRMEVLDLAGAEFVSEWDFSIAPSYDELLANLLVTHMSGPVATVAAGANSFHAVGGSRFDLSFRFPTHGDDSRFRSGAAVYQLTGLAGLTAADFNQIAWAPPGASAGAWRTAARIQAFGQDSGWVVDGSRGVPEPASLALFAAGAIVISIGVYISMRRLRRRAHARASVPGSGTD